MPRYRGVIFDVDGTLVDSNDAHTRAWVSAFRDEGFQVEPEDVRPWIGMGGDQLVGRVAGIEKDDPLAGRLSERWKEHFRNEEMPGLSGFDGVRDLVQELRGQGVRLIVGTSADASLVAGLLETAGVKDVLTEYTTASDVEASKPEPDIVQAALEKLDLRPEEVLMVGDTPFDIEAARRAGVDTVALRCGGDDRFEGAVAVFENPRDLLSNLEGVLNRSAEQTD